MTDDERLEELDYNCGISRQRTLYAVVSHGDGYYYGPPEAVFFSETPAHIYKDTVTGRAVIEVPLYQTERDGWEVESTSNLHTYRVMNAIMGEINSASGDAIATVIEKFGITPDDFISEDVVDDIATEMATSPGHIPLSWEKEVNDVRHRRRQGEPEGDE